MNYTRLKVEHLTSFCLEMFTKLGFCEQDAKTITDVLILADLYGIESHGVQRLIRYYNGIRKNSIHVDAKPEIVFETPVISPFSTQYSTPGVYHLSG